ncbi:MAG TPA: MtrB/PioB family outer membrane beta-barrel protein [Vicinamibacterales bacterium]|nr:MtrB/PioB family outer membrane beta-barrel protein [Vicinamibacterales bacterium]
MRTRLFAIAGAALLASAINVYAQAPQPVTPVELSPWIGSIDLGYRGNDSTGDLARYERYRDVQSGTFSQLAFEKKTSTFNFDASAFNIGRRDQRFKAAFTGSRVRFTAGFDSIPLNYGYGTSSPWVETTPNVFSLDPAARQLVQAKSLVGVPQNIVDLTKTSIYRTISPTFDLSQLRQTGSAKLLFDISEYTSFNATFTETRKTGSQPWGASFAFNVADELPMTLDNRTHDASAGLEYTREQGMMRVAWNASWFDNNIKQLVWDNPYRATDTTPFDASGYSNGNGPAQGRMSVPPSNTLNTVSAVALYKMPAHTTINGTIAFTQMNQDEALIPWTINPVIANTTVYKSFPELASLPRSTAQAKVDGVNGVLNFTSRPTQYVSFTARYRYNDHVNKTPVFDAREYVRFDAVPEETGGETEQFNITENTFDAAVAVKIAPFTSLKLGYGYDAFDRTGRAFSNMTDNAFRASIDTVGNQFITVRALYEHVDRKGSGFSEDAIEEGGSQPGLRFYDEADRQRDRGTLLFVLNPVDAVDVTLSMSTGKDTYNGAGHDFGLLDNDNTNVNIGVGFTPSQFLNFGANYGRDHYASNQKSRNANPPPDPQFTDPTRDWTLNNTENVNNFNAYVDVPKAFGNKTNVKISYDYSDSDNGFVFGGPRVAALAAVGQFIPLPNVTNTWQRFAADFSYYFQKQVGVAVGYWYEKLDVSDFATIDLPGSPGTPRIDYLGEISTGYGNRPYKGNTAFVRLLYRF